MNIGIAPNITFACTRLYNTNKVGDLKKNADGYYVMVVGALNMFNSAGMYYDFKAAEHFFKSSSALMRRIEGGNLRGESGHPEYVSGMSNQEYFARLLRIDPKRVVCHFASLTLNFNDYKDEKGRPIVAIIAEVCPSGELGHVLEKQLANPRENVSFSIRSFTDDKLVGGIVTRYIKNIVTFDYVLEPGMSVAEKFNKTNPALEAYSDESFVISQAEAEAGARLLAGTYGVGNESVQLNTDEFFNTMGWQSPTAPKSSPRASSSYSW